MGRDRVGWEAPGASGRGIATTQRGDDAARSCSVGARAYGHTSHGSQLVSGMTGLVAFRGPAYAFRAGGGVGVLDLRDTPFSGASDLGAPDRTAWASATRACLRAQPSVNVVLWSWCGQVSNATAGDITTYLTPLTFHVAIFSTAERPAGRQFVRSHAGRSPVSCHVMSDIGIRPAAVNSSMNAFIVNRSPSWRRLAAISDSICALPIR